MTVVALQNHIPRSLLDGFERGIDSFDAAMWIGVNSDGSLTYDSCGMEKRDVLWLLECARIKLMSDDDS